MPKPILRAINPEIPHARELAKRAVKDFRSNVERERLPICNQDHSGARSLRVDEVITKTERFMPEDEYRKPFPWGALIGILACVIGLIWILFYGGMN